MNENFINIIVGVALAILSYFGIKGHVKVKKIEKIITGDIPPVDETEDTVFSERDERMIDLFYSKIKNTISQYKYVVPAPLALAVFKQESAGLWRTKTNGQVFGDINLINKAWGYFQVRLPALIDVNNRYGYNYTEQDLSIESVNFIVGIGYLNYCWQKALSEGAINPARNALQKYNGGIGRKESDFSGSVYAGTVSTYFIEFSNLG